MAQIRERPDLLRLGRSVEQGLAVGQRNDVVALAVEDQQRRLEVLDQPDAGVGVGTSPAGMNG